MLKGCWDCVIGSGVLQAREGTEGAYGSRLTNGTQVANGASPLLPWPSPIYDNEIMFLLPRVLRIGDSVNVTGVMRRNPQSLVVNLVTGYSSSIDYQNIACQIAVDFTADNIAVRIIENGNEIINGANSASSMFSVTEEEFKFRFEIDVNSNSESGTYLNVFIGSSFLEQIQLKHSLEQIRYLTLSGDIHKVNNLDFNFA